MKRWHQGCTLILRLSFLFQAFTDSSRALDDASLQLGTGQCSRDALDYDSMIQFLPTCSSAMIMEFIDPTIGSEAFYRWVNS